jgi:hypothetical protein
MTAAFFAIVTFTPASKEIVTPPADSGRKPFEITHEAKLAFLPEIFPDRPVAEAKASDVANARPGDRVFVVAPVYETVRA